MPDRPRAGTIAAALAATCAAGGSIAVALAVIAGPGPALAGYVSEAGSPTSRTALAYRLGVLGLSAALLLLAAALPRPLRLATGLLVASSAATALSAAVPCSAGCPLPPYQPATFADLVHGGASISAVAGTVFAMVAVTLSAGAGRPLRLVSALTTAVALPLSLTVGLAMLSTGWGILVGVTERLLLVDLAVWVVATAVMVGLTRPARPGPDGQL